MQELDVRTEKFTYGKDRALYTSVVKSSLRLLSRARSSVASVKEFNLPGHRWARREVHLWPACDAFYFFVGSDFHAEKLLE